VLFNGGKSRLLESLPNLVDELEGRFFEILEGLLYEGLEDLNVLEAG
jgi:hypothetical protein